MSPWLKPRLLALCCGALLIGGASYLHAQEGYGPASKTPEEAAINFWKLLDVFRRLERVESREADTGSLEVLTGSIERSQFEALQGAEVEKFFSVFAAQAVAPSFEGQVQSANGSQTIVSVSPTAQTKAREVVVIKEDGGYRVDMVATYARWNHLSANEADKALYRATGWISPTLAKQKEFMGGATFTACQSNLKQIGLGIAQYTQDYDEELPPARRWQEVLQPYLKNEELYTCPALRPKSNGYAYNSKTSQVSLESIPAPSQTVQMYETSNLNRDVFAPFTGRAYRHSHNGEIGMNIGFVDGHVRWFKHGTDTPPFSSTTPAPASE